MKMAVKECQCVHTVAEYLRKAQRAEDHISQREGRRVIATPAPVRTREIVHSMGLIPYGRPHHRHLNVEINEVKSSYLHDLFCSVMEGLIWRGIEGG